MSTEANYGSGARSNSPSSPSPREFTNRCLRCIVQLSRCFGCGKFFLLPLPRCRDCIAGITKPWKNGNPEVEYVDPGKNQCPPGNCLAWGGGQKV